MQTTVKQPQQVRLIYLDLIKVLAIFMVLYNHRTTYTMANTLTGYTFKTLLIQVLALLCRCGVPLFFMASGVLLLKKNEPFCYVLRHRVARILIVMLICTLIIGGGGLAWTFFTQLNWYLYAYFDYLLMLPFIRYIAQNATKEQAKLFICFMFFFYTLNGVFIYMKLHTGFIDFAPIYNTQVASLWSMIFTLTGYWIANYRVIVDKRFMSWLVVGTAVSIALGVFMTMSDISQNAGVNIDQLRVHFIYVPTVLIFVLARVVAEDVSLLQIKMVKRAIVTVSGTTFGIFIIETHSQLINYINWKLSLSSFTKYLGDYEMGVASIVVQFIACFTITYCLKHIPYVKKLL